HSTVDDGSYGSSARAVACDGDSRSRSVASTRVGDGDCGNSAGGNGRGRGCGDRILGGNEHVMHALAWAHGASEWQVVVDASQLGVWISCQAAVAVYATGGTGVAWDELGVGGLDRQDDAAQEEQLVA